MQNAEYRLIRRTGKFLFPALLLAAAVVALYGCAGPEGGSSIPWAEPESWENQPTFGVPY